MPMELAAQSLGGTSCLPAEAGDGRTLRTSLKTSECVSSTFRVTTTRDVCASKISLDHLAGGSILIG